MLPLLASAGTANVSWTNATTNTDGTAIPATCTTTPCGRLTSTIVEYGSCSGTNVFGTKVGEITSPPTTLNIAVNLVVIQTYCFRAKHINDYTESSGYTNVLSKANIAPVPNPPATFTMANSVVYQFIGIKDKVSLLPVGTIAGNIQCDSTQSVNGHYAVPSDLVAWYGSVKPKVVFALCS